MKHLREDDLVLYHYGEIRTEPAQRHISVCRGCRDRLRAMRLDPELLARATSGRPAPPRAESAGGAEKRSRPLPVWRRLLLRLALAGMRR